MPSINGLLIAGYLTAVVVLSKKPETLLATFEKVECVADNNYVNNISCGTRKINSYITGGFFRFTAVKFVKVPYLHLVLYKEHAKNVFKPFVLNSTVNICHIFKKGMKMNFIMSAAFATFRNTNVFDACPLTIGYYFIDNFYFSPNASKGLPFPTGRFRADGVVFFNLKGSRKELFNYSCYMKASKSRKYVE